MYLNKGFSWQNDGGKGRNILQLLAAVAGLRGVSSADLETGLGQES